MKKILSAILAGTMLFGSAIAFSGCGGSKESKSDESSAASAKSDATSDSATSDSAEKGANGELHMATNAFFEPYEYTPSLLTTWILILLSPPFSPARLTSVWRA